MLTDLNLHLMKEAVSFGGLFGMGSLNYLILVLLITFVGNIQAEPETTEIAASIAVFTTELERLSSKVSELELILKDKNSDLNIKRNLVAQREKEIEGQSQTINSVQNMIGALQQKESGDTNTQVAMAYARIRELETQVESLKESIRKQKQERTYFKLQADEAEKKAKEQVSKYEKMEYFVSEQWVSIRQTEQALQIAEEIMLKAQVEAAAKADNLSKAYRGWLPPWIGVNLPELQTLATSYWVEHVESVMNILRAKVCLFTPWKSEQDRFFEAPTNKMLMHEVEQTLRR